METLIARTGAINRRTGKRLNLWHFEKMIDKWASRRSQSIKLSGKNYHLITLMGL